MGADQILACDGRFYHKPGNLPRAVEQLKTLLGKTHSLFTAIALVRQEPFFSHIECVVSELSMGDGFSEAYLQKVVQADRSWDCVGSYKLESLGITLFEKIQTTDYTSIVGLPLMALSKQLRLLKFIGD